MLNSNDIQLIKQFRKDATTLRTTPAVLHRQTQTGQDPYTKEPIYAVSTETVEVNVKGFTGVVGGEQLIVNGEVIQQGDVKMAFDYSIDLTDVQVVEHGGIKYKLVSIYPKGIGEPNRYECVARRAT